MFNDMMGPTYVGFINEACCFLKDLGLYEEFKLKIQQDERLNLMIGVVFECFEDIEPDYREVKKKHGH